MAAPAAYQTIKRAVDRTDGARRKIDSPFIGLFLISTTTPAMK